MSKELVRKSEVIDVFENLIYDMEGDNDITLPVMAKEVIENMKPVNAVELPCKVHDKIYEITDRRKKSELEKVIVERTVLAFEVDSKGIVFFITGITTIPICEKQIGYTAFYTREEAERALEEIKK